MAYLNAQRENADRPGELFPHVRNFPGGGAPKPPQLYYDMKKEMGAPILSGYGLTEAPILTMARASDPDDKLANTEGAPMPGVELKLVTLDGKIAGPGEEGEIRAKAPQVMKGYLDTLAGRRSASTKRATSARATSAASTTATSSSPDA